MSIFTPDNFKNDWYGWITNQWGHALLGQVIFGLVMLASLEIGEFASRLHVWVSITLVYMLWEFATHKKGYWWDSVEDCIFVCLYGAGWIAFAFSEVKAGSPAFYGNALAIIPIIGLFAFHSALGVLLRVYGRASK